MTPWRVIIMPEAKKRLAAIKDATIQQGLKNALRRLEDDPDKRGKPLHEKLMGFRSLRAVGERYRIVYQVIDRSREVHVVTLGIRREGSRNDVYVIAEKLFDAQIIQRE